MKKHTHYFENDDSPCIICGITTSELADKLFEESKPKKTKKKVIKQVKKIPYLDYACKIGERVQWANIKGEKFEGILISWEDEVARLKLDDGTEQFIPC